MPATTVLRRCVATGGVLAAVAGAFFLGAATGPAGDTGPRPSLASYAGSGLAPASGCAELREWYVERGLERVGPWGWDQPVIYTSTMGLPGDTVVDGFTADAAGVPAAARVSGQTSEATGTNVQEAGVDEPDVVKTDGSTLFRVEGDDVVAYDVSGEAVRRLGEVNLPRMSGTEIVLAGSRIVAIGQVLAPVADVPDELSMRMVMPPLESETRVVVLDVSDPASPKVMREATYDSSFVTARLHGGVVRLVLQAGLPDLPFVQPGRGRPDAAALRENRLVVKRSAVEDWLPEVRVDDRPTEPLVDCTDVAIPEDGGTLGTIVVVAFDPTAPAIVESAGLAADTVLAYASTDQLYLATSAAWGPVCCWAPSVSRLPWQDDGVSRIYAFDLDGLATRFAASGEVDGAIRDRWSMDAVDGVLRVAVGPSQRTGDFSSVVTFRQEGNDLVENGRLDELGIDEEIQSVRWFDDLAIVVTFRQVDPLYAVDLTDPTAPRLLGALKIPGFSSYLHPLDDQRILGMGEGPTGRGGWGAQAGLFDISDLTDVRRLDVHSYGDATHANAGSDSRQLTWLPEKRTALTVVTKWRDTSTGYVSVLRLEDGRLHNRMVAVERGWETGQIRLVPLPDGRVVLTTGDGVEFFAV